MKIPIKEILREKNIDYLIKSDFGPAILCKWEEETGHISLPEYADIYIKNFELILNNFLKEGKKEGLNKKQATKLLYNYFLAPLHLNFEINENGCKKITTILKEIKTIRRKELFSLMCKHNSSTKSLYSEAKTGRLEKEPLVWKTKFFDLIDGTKKPVYSRDLDIIGAQACVGCIAHESYHRKSNNWENSKYNDELYEGITEWLALKHMPSPLRIGHAKELKNEVELAGCLSYIVGNSKLEKVYMLGSKDTEKAIFKESGIKIKENEKASSILKRIIKNNPLKIKRWKSYLFSTYIKN